MMDEQHKEVQQRGGSQEEQSKKAMRDNVMRIALTSEARQRLTKHIQALAGIKAAMGSHYCRRKVTGMH